MQQFIYIDEVIDCLQQNDTLKRSVYNAINTNKLIYAQEISHTLVVQ
jgi:hypothetical protein